jgi:hypothetical protein
MPDLIHYGRFLLICARFLVGQWLAFLCLLSLKLARMCFLKKSDFDWQMCFQRVPALWPVELLL